MRLPVAVSALSVQIGASLIAFSAFVAGAHIGLSPVWFPVLVQSAAAVLLSRMLGLPVWWLPIQGLFVPLLLFTLSLNLSSNWFLGGFVLLWLIFFSNVKERVPLYLSNVTTCRALAELLPDRQHVRFLDLGCGTGGVVAHLAGRMPEGLFEGIESAPLPFLMSWLRLKRKGNAQVRYGTMWNENLAAYDVVYAFLSPEPMSGLWRKAENEMRAGTLFVSNSFAVPGREPARVVELQDARRTRLLIWKM